MAAQLRFSPLQSPVASLVESRRSFGENLLIKPPSIFLPTITHLSSSASLSLLPRSSNPNLSQAFTAGGDGIGGSGHRGSGGGGGGGGDENEGQSGDKSERSDLVGPIGLFVNGWRSRVLADPQFPFKVLMEEVVGVSACVLGDMASRANFGLNELDFVFCTLVVGSIVNFVLMYLLAPTAAVSSASAASLPSYMFEPGPFSLLERIGTFAYKGATFAAVGFAAGLAGTAISNGLISLRKKMDPEFETPNKAPPTVLNAITWALHMGLSSNTRYQTLNGVEFVMEKALPPVGFKVSVVALRCLNNVLGGMSFVMLARLTGSQKVGAEEAKVSLLTEGSAVVESGNGELQSSDSHCK